ncbi:probable serine/threonine-protein kinase WNK5 [Chenopodium quinoa]|uniref:non-specific serine/threonine protein kinase n=1 Tax=Chenopodium quinoa TaxID=63459 RepID=A0A803MW50_CHEQI|nr:probable serine/threonine-protein kinase WNK5 [Chenopodium quinoa]
MALVTGGRTQAETDDSADYAETDPTGRYARLNEILGKGAVKTVYKAIDEVLGIEVAWNQAKIKDVLRSPEQLERLYSEVHLLSTLNHDSIIRFYTSWIDTKNRTFNFITELFTSGTLRQYREKYKRVNIQAIKRWSRQILQGLVYLHGHDPPVIHRDLKCDNIFVNGHVGQVKIGDLGLAALLSGSKSAHAIIGTPEFMAPELYEEDYDELVDVYSFGMCLLEMLTLEYPYSECVNPAHIYKKVTMGKLPTAVNLIQDKEAQQFVKKCLAPKTKRLSASDLLLDPFLSSVAGDLLLTKVKESENPILNSSSNLGKLMLVDTLPRTNMTITGTLKPKDGIIFLKVQISDGHGPARNIFFPFDIISDTPEEVALEMVQELEITDWDPKEIAEMIEAEISVLMPHWKRPVSSRSQPYDYQEYNYDGARGLYNSSSCSSSIASASGVLSSHESDQLFLEDFPDECSSYSSTRTDKTTNLSCSSIADVEGFTGCKRKSSKDKHRLTRNRSLIDVQSQKLHRSLLEEVMKKRLSKTVGAVENIGFQSPFNISTSQGRRLAQTTRDDKRQGKIRPDEALKK